MAQTPVAGGGNAWLLSKEGQCLTVHAPGRPGRLAAMFLLPLLPDWLFEGPGPASTGWAGTVGGCALPGRTRTFAPQGERGGPGPSWPAAPASQDPSRRPGCNRPGRPRERFGGLVRVQRVRRNPTDRYRSAALGAHVKYQAVPIVRPGHYWDTRGRLHDGDRRPHPAAARRQ
jgi:hypothetical protein